MDTRSPRATWQDAADGLVDAVVGIRMAPATSSHRERIDSGVALHDASP